MSISARGYYSIKGEGTSTHTKKASFSDDFFVIVLTSIHVRTYQMVFTLDVHRANTSIWKKSNDEPAKYVVAHSVLISKLGETICSGWSRVYVCLGISVRDQISSG
jgi:hypothetical protein